MGISVEAILFYGYIEPVRGYDYGTGETAWDKAHTRRDSGCIGGIYGYDEHLGNFLAVEASLHKAGWDRTISLVQDDFGIGLQWHIQLQQALCFFGIDVADLLPGWHLISLYF